MASGEVRELPVKPELKQCSDCVHGALGQYGVYCTVFNDWVVDERAVAEECAEFAR